MKNIDISIFKAYDIRGVCPDQIDADLVYRIAQAYAKFLNPKKVAIGHDMRLSGEEFSQAAISGLTDAGVDVIDIGLVSTDTLYFATVMLKVDGGLMVTASHNPKEYGGLKMVRENGRPISGDTGIKDIRNLVVDGIEVKADKKGEVTKHDVFTEYIAHVLKPFDVKAMKPLKVVANTNFGMASVALKGLQEYLPVQFVEILNGELNGNFPKGRPDPLIPSNRDETIAAVQKHGADLGVAWDADADRCFFFDEKGRFLSGYYTTAMLSGYYLNKYPQSKVVVDMKLNWAIKDTVKQAGGEPLTERTGHSFFKEKMIQTGAVFGGEVSGHYYFKDNYYLDNGIMPFLAVLDYMSSAGKKLSEIYQPYFEKYFAIEETNITVNDVPTVLDGLKKKYEDAEISELDGISLEYPGQWRVNVRASNTEPLLRINLEAVSKELMEEKQKEVMEFVQSIK